MSPQTNGSLMLYRVLLAISVTRLVSFAGLVSLVGGFRRSLQRRMRLICPTESQYQVPRCFDLPEQVGCPPVKMQVRILRPESLTLSPRTET